MSQGTNHTKSPKKATAYWKHGKHKKTAGMVLGLQKNKPKQKTEPFEFGPHTTIKKGKKR